MELKPQSDHEGDHRPLDIGALYSLIIEGALWVMMVKTTKAERRLRKRVRNLERVVAGLVMTSDVNVWMSTGADITADMPEPTTVFVYPEDEVVESWDPGGYL